MKKTIHPSQLKGVIQSPASKSSMQRACAAALLHKGISFIHNPGHSNDDKAALDIIGRLGAIIEKIDEDTLRVTSKGVEPVSGAIDCGESGLSIRMFTPLAALSKEIVTINGSGSLVTRPMHFFDEILPALGVEVSSEGGYLPLKVKGPLKPVDIEVDGSLSSQFLTGLLMAYSAAGASGVEIRVRDLKSKPYIDLTLEVMKQFGMAMPENNGYTVFHFPEKKHSTEERDLHYTVEGDWSGAAFLLVAGAIAGPLLVRGLDLQSAQADRKIMEALEACGAGMAVEAKGIRLVPASLKAFTFDATDCPDLFPPLVALAAYCEGTTQISGVSRLAHKESNRGLTLQEEFAKMGVTIRLEGDLMVIEGGKGVKGAKVHSRHDHRIAMACAVAALRAEAPVSIEEAQAVNKSYPDFYRDLELMGATVRGINLMI